MGRSTMLWLQYSAIENEEGKVAQQYKTINMKVISLLCMLLSSLLLVAVQMHSSCINLQQAR